MASSLFIFRDPNAGVVRVSANDPSSLLTPLGFAKSVVSIPGGVHLDAFVRQAEPLVGTLKGPQGLEVFFEIAVGDIDLAALASGGGG